MTGQASKPGQPPIIPLSGPGLHCSRFQGPYSAVHPDAYGLTHLSWLPPPSLQESKRRARNQEARKLLNQQPRDRVQAWAERKGFRLQGLEWGAQVPTCYSSQGSPWVWTCPEGRPPGPGGASTVSPTPPPQPFPRRRNQGGGARPAGL